MTQHHTEIFGFHLWVLCLTGLVAGVACDDGPPTSNYGNTPHPGPKNCDNDVKDDNELCDGSDHCDATCESLGLGNGNLICASTCLSFDTTGCEFGCVPECGAQSCGLDPVCGKSCGKCGLEEMCNTDNQCEPIDPDAPSFLSFNTNISTMTPGDTLIFAAVLTDPNGVEDLVGGTLIDSQNSAGYGAFVGTGAGAFTLSLQWGEINLANPITATGPTGIERTFKAEFYDQGGHRRIREVAVMLRCSGSDLTPCAGTCTDLQSDGEHCGDCGTVCGTADNGSVVCSSGDCELVCDGSYHDCSSVCVTDDSVDHCQDHCTPCPTVENSSVRCGSSGCEYDCDGDTLYCGGTCVGCPTRHAQEFVCDGNLCAASVCEWGYTVYDGHCDTLPAFRGLVVNEIMADPSGEDYNNDGTYVAGQDEYVEILNASAGAMDMNGVQIANGSSGYIVHVFGDFSLPAGEAALVFGGGEPFFYTPGVVVEVSSPLALSLNNGGDSVFLLTPNGMLIDDYEYSSLNAEAWVRDPQGTGDFVRHSAAAGAAGAIASPGKCTNGSLYPGCNQ